MKLSEKTKLQLKYGPALIPGLIVAVANASLFEIKCNEQMEFSNKLQNLDKPLNITKSVNWIIVILCLAAIAAACWPKPPQPVICFGLSFWIIFPTLIASFRGMEMSFSHKRYERDLKVFNIKTIYHRRLTHYLLKFLNDETEKRKWECCGLTSYKDFDYPSKDKKTMEVRSDVFGDEKHNTMIDIDFKGFLRGDYEKKPEYNETQKLGKFEFASKVLQGDLPQSCCIKSKSECAKIDGIFGKADGQKLVYQKGCRTKLLKPFKKCKAILPFTCSAPWIIFFLMVIPSWCYLRGLQGLSPFQFSSAERVPLADEKEETDKGGVPTELDTTTGAKPEESTDEVKPSAPKTKVVLFASSATDSLITKN